MQITAEDSGWARVQRFEIAWHALQLAELLGAEATARIADRIVVQFLAPEPSPLDGGHLEVPLRIPRVCIRAIASPTAQSATRSVTSKAPRAHGARSCRTQRRTPE